MQGISTQTLLPQGSRSKAQFVKTFEPSPPAWVKASHFCRVPILKGMSSYLNLLTGEILIQSFQKVEIHPIQVSAELQCKEHISEGTVSTSQNHYAMASVQFILKNTRYRNTHPLSNLSLLHQSLFSLHLYSPCQNTDQFLLDTLFFLKCTELISTQGTSQTFKEHYFCCTYS